MNSLVGPPQALYRCIKGLHLRLDVELGLWRTGPELGSRRGGGGASGPTAGAPRDGCTGTVSTASEGETSSEGQSESSGAPSTPTDSRTGSGTGSDACSTSAGSGSCETGSETAHEEEEEPGTRGAVDAAASRDVTYEAVSEPGGDAAEHPRRAQQDDRGAAIRSYRRRSKHVLK